MAKTESQQPNLRKLAELPYQQIEAKQWEALNGTLTDIDFLMVGVLRRELLDNLISDFQRALEKTPHSEQEDLRAWGDCFLSNQNILRRGDSDYPTHRILLQIALDYPEEDASITRKAECWMGEKCDWPVLRKINKSSQSVCRTLPLSQINGGPIVGVVPFEIEGYPRILIATKTGLFIWKPDEGKIEKQLNAEGVTCIVAEGAKVFTGHVDGGVTFWEIEKGNHSMPLDIPKAAPISRLCFDAAQEVLYSLDPEGTIARISNPSGKPNRKILIPGCCPSPDNIRLDQFGQQAWTQHSDGIIRKWDLERGRCIRWDHGGTWPDDALKQTRIDDLKRMVSGVTFRGETVDACKVNDTVIFAQISPPSIDAYDLSTGRRIWRRHHPDRPKAVDFALTQTTFSVLIESERLVVFNREGDFIRCTHLGDSSRVQYPRHGLNGVTLFSKDWIVGHRNEAHSAAKRRGEFACGPDRGIPECTPVLVDARSGARYDLGNRKSYVFSGGCFVSTSRDIGDEEGSNIPVIILPNSNNLLLHKVELRGDEVVLHDHACVNLESSIDVIYGGVVFKEGFMALIDDCLRITAGQIQRAIDSSGQPAVGDYGWLETGSFQAVGGAYLGTNDVSLFALEDGLLVWKSCFLSFFPDPKEMRSDSYGTEIDLLDLSPDGRWVVVCARNSDTLTLWCAKTGRKIAKYKGIAHKTGGAQWSKDGRHLAVWTKGVMGDYRPRIVRLQETSNPANSENDQVLPEHNIELIETEFPLGIKNVIFLGDKVAIQATTPPRGFVFVDLDTLKVEAGRPLEESEKSEFEKIKKDRRHRRDGRRLNESDKSTRWRKTIPQAEFISEEYDREYSRELSRINKLGLSSSSILDHMTNHMIGWEKINPMPENPVAQWECESQIDKSFETPDGIVFIAEIRGHIHILKRIDPK